MKHKILVAIVFSIFAGCAVFALQAGNGLSRQDEKAILKSTRDSLESDDERLPKKVAAMKRAIRYYHSGNNKKAKAALNQVDAISPFEVPDTASWQMHDIVACKADPKFTVETGMAYCARGFETGELNCTNRPASNSECRAYYCEPELWNSLYSGNRSEPIEPKYKIELDNAIKMVSRICSKR